MAEFVKISTSLLRPRERLQSIVMSMSVCGSVCLSVRQDISEPHARSLPNLLCMLPVSVARSSSDMFTIGRIAYRWEVVFFPIENALSAGKVGWECTARAKYAIYYCLVVCCGRQDSLSRYLCVCWWIELTLIKLIKRYQQSEQTFIYRKTDISSVYAHGACHKSRPSN